MCDRASFSEPVVVEDIWRVVFFFVNAFLNQLFTIFSPHSCCMELALYTVATCRLHLSSTLSDMWLGVNRGKEGLWSMVGYSLVAVGRAFISHLVVVVTRSHTALKWHHWQTNGGQSSMLLQIVVASYRCQSNFHEHNVFGSSVRACSLFQMCRSSIP